MFPYLLKRPGFGAELLDNAAQGTLGGVDPRLGVEEPQAAVDLESKDKLDGEHSLDEFAC
jgi:hypothetical protein